LDSVLPKLPRQAHPGVLIGFDAADDAGVYQVAPDLALVQTVDFFTPIVDDPYTFGKIAAANSLSDVYAMRGRPVSSLAIVGFPAKSVSPDVLEQILRGGLEKMQEAECAVIGGHSIGDDEIKFGYAVTGLIHPARVVSNAGAQPGDRLILTKRIGTGVVATALKKQWASAAAVSAAVESMLQLNRAASETLGDFEVHAATDVTGFGLLGHSRGVALASGVSLRFDHTEFEFLPGGLQYAREGFLAGGLKNNRDFLAGCVYFAGEVPEDIRHLLYDPQTSGGLLISVAARDSEGLLASLRERSLPAHMVGEAVTRTDPLLAVY
jgi:selenide,water dikinase